MRKLVAPFLLLLLVLVVFHSWFTSELLSSYDVPFYSSLMMKGASLQLYAWDWHPGFDGFAGFFSPYSWVFPLIYMPQVVFGNLLGMDWSAIERIMYLYPLVILLISSPVFLIRYLFPENKFYLISVLVFSFNTYSLLLAGGEVFIALAYVLAPLVFISFIKLINLTGFKTRLKNSIIAGLVLAAQIMIDPRITYVTMFAVGLYLLPIFYSFLYKKRIRDVLYLIFYSFIIPGVITILLHAFWIIPTVLYGKNPVNELGSAYSTTEAVRYLSFAKLEQTISLLHSNWPENIFGKVGFMKPEFLLMPILSFSSLLFINFSRVNKNVKNYSSSEAKRSREAEMVNSSRQARTIIFFAFLGLIGAFLSKGVNDPFGGIYLWMFGHVPGFIMFRDPTKWYPLVAISYSVLIPFTIWKIYERLSKITKFSIFSRFNRDSIKSKLLNFQNLFLVFVIIFLLFLIHPALFSQLGGMFKTTSVPHDYVKLEKFLYNQPGFFRTLWVPSKQHFGFYSNTHPEMSAQILFNIFDDNSLFKKLTDRGVEKLLQEASIKYVIVPFDSEKEIFITDRKYDNTRYQKTISRLREIKWLREVEGFGKITVFEIENPKDHFWSPTSKIKISYKFINPTNYMVSVNNAKKGDRLVFSEKFDNYWKAQQIIGGGSQAAESNLESSKFSIFNSFILPENGDYSLEVYYKPQEWVDIGTRISVITFVLAVVAFVIASVAKQSL